MKGSHPTPPSAHGKRAGYQGTGYTAAHSRAGQIQNGAMQRQSATRLPAKIR